MATVAAILDELKGTPTLVIPILKHLTFTRANGFTPEETRHLIARTLNLARLGQAYHKWCGTVIIKTLALNIELIASDGVVMMDVLLQNLHGWNPTMDTKVLTATVDTINFMCDQIRGKDTLVREILTPKLTAKGSPLIISGYLNQLQYAPGVVVPLLHKILINHPTVFRTYGNKFYAALVQAVALPNFDGFPVSLQKAIYGAIAAMPVIENTKPEDHWEIRVAAVVRELLRVLSVYSQLLHFEDDGELSKLLQSLERVPSVDATIKEPEPIFPDLSIDFNSPATVLQLSSRVKALVQLLTAYLTQGCKLAVEVPIGKVLGVVEAIVLINPKFQHYKFDVRDGSIQTLVNTLIELNHIHAVELLAELIPIYAGSIIPHFARIVSTLETVIPLANKRVDTKAVVKQERFFGHVLAVVADLLELVTTVTDNTILLRFVDVALAIVEPRVGTIPPKPKQGSGKKKRKQGVPLADLLTNANLLIESIPEKVLGQVRGFFQKLITKVAALLPTYHYKIMRYLIIETVLAKYYNLYRQPPAELRQLLLDAVAYPGYEKVSILPIVCLLFGDDPLVLVFTHPRFPPLPQYIDLTVSHQVHIEEEDDEEETEEQEEKVHEKRPLQQEEDAPAKRRKIDSIEVAQPEANVVPTTIDPPKLAEPETKPADEPKPKVPQLAEIPSQPEEEGDDSDFEMPALDGGDSDDE